LTGVLDPILSSTWFFAILYIYHHLSEEYRSWCNIVQ
jgi:hypothetical protein